VASCPHDFACYCKQARRKLRIVTKPVSSVLSERAAYFEGLDAIRITELGFIDRENYTRHA